MLPWERWRQVAKMCTKHQYLQMVLQHDTLQQVKTYKNFYMKKIKKNKNSVGPTDAEGLKKKRKKKIMKKEEKGKPNQNV